MKKRSLWQMNVLLCLLLILGLIAPLSVLAEGEYTPSLNQNADGVYEISTAAELESFRQDLIATGSTGYLDETVVLTADIDMTGQTIGKCTGKFKGTFNGRGHTITLTQNLTAGTALIPKNYGTIQNINLLVNCPINDPGDGITPLCQYNTGVIRYVNVTGQINIAATALASDEVGVIVFSGIIAGSTRTSIVEDCYSGINFELTGTQDEISTYKEKPGFLMLYQLAYNPNKNGTINRCLVTGTFDENLKKNAGVENSNTDLAIIGTSSDNPLGINYYDKTLFEPSRINGGNSNPEDASKYIGKTTAELQQQATFADWDFDVTWGINEGSSYPYLTFKDAVMLTAKPVIADKTWNVEQDTTAEVTGMSFDGLTDDQQALIDNYGVSLNYAVDSAAFVATTAKRSDDPLQNVGSQKVEVQYSTSPSLVVANADQAVADGYVFKLVEVLDGQGNVVFDNTIPGPDESKQQELIEKAKEANSIIFEKYIGDGSSYLQPFTYEESGSQGAWEFTQDHWAMFSAARGGYYPGDDPEFYDKWFANVKTSLHTMKEKGITAEDMKYTAWAKLVLAITAAGYDARDIEDYDLIGILSDINMQEQGLYLQSATALLALEGGGYELTAENPIVNLATYGQERADSLNSYPDASVCNGDNAMFFQPMCFFMNEPVVKTAVENYMYNRVGGDNPVLQNGDGSFTTKGEPLNAYNNAQVMIALGCFDMSVFDDRFVQNGNTVLDAQFNFIDFDNRTYQGSYEITQLTRGFTAVIRQYEGRSMIFDTSNIDGATKPVNDLLIALNDNSSQEQIDAAKAAYDALSDAKKASIKSENLAKIMPISEDQAAANVVIDLIKALPEVSEMTLEDETAVSAARIAYDALTDTRKSLISEENVVLLVAAETAIKDLKPDSGTVTIDVERFTIGQGFFKEPVTMTYTKGDTVMDLLKKLVGEENIVGSTSNVSGIKGANLGTATIPAYITNDLGGPTTEAANEAGSKDPAVLAAADYDTLYGYVTGWMYLVNDELPNITANDYVLEDGDVVRWAFTVWGYGADIDGVGMGGFGLDPIDISNKDVLLKALAAVNSADNREVLLGDTEVKAAYDNAISVCSDAMKTAAEVQQAADALNQAVADPQTVDQDAADDVMNMIAALPAVADITLDNEIAVAAARSDYDALTDVQRALISKDSLEVLEAAEAKIYELKPDAGTVTMDIERFTIGQGFYVEPVTMAYKEGDTVFDLLGKAAGAENIVGDSSYVTGIKGADAGTDSVVIPDYIISVFGGGDTTAAKEYGNSLEGSALGSYSYSEQAGWMYMVNNEMPYDAIGEHPVQDGDVIRFAFTYYGWGADLTGYEYDASWNQVLKIEIGNRDELLKAIAAINSADNREELLEDTKVKAAYDNAIVVVSDLTKTSEETQAAAAALAQTVADQAVADGVISQIGRLPVVADLKAGDKADVSKVRSAYNELTETQKTLVSNIDKLTAAEAKIEELLTENPPAKDETTGIEVVGLPKGPEGQQQGLNVSDDTNDEQKAEIKKQAQEAAKKAGLKEVEIVTLYDIKPDMSDDDLAAFNADDTLYVTITLPIPQGQEGNSNYVIYHLKEDGTVEWITPVLSEDGKYLIFKVTSFSEFGIVAGDKMTADEEAAQTVIDLIADLPATDSLTLDNQADVQAARNAYDVLTAEQQLLVGNYDTLTAAEAKITELSDPEAGGGGAAADPDQEAADVVIAQIDALGTINSYSQKAAVEAARSAYDGLTAAQQALVTNYSILTAAEAKIETLKPTINITVDVERFTIGQGFYVEPKTLSIPEGTSAREALEQLLGAGNLVGDIGYLRAVKGADTGSVTIPDYIVNELSGGDTSTAKSYGQKYSGSTLGEFDYSSYSGWMYFVNNQTPSYGMNEYTLKNGDVLRLAFTYWATGGDLTGHGYIGTGMDRTAINMSFTPANRDNILKALAKVKGNSAYLNDEAISEAYNSAMTVVQDMTSSSKVINATATLLNEAIANYDPSNPGELEEETPVVRDEETGIEAIGLPEGVGLVVGDLGQDQAIEEAAQKAAEDQGLIGATVLALYDIKPDMSAEELEAFNNDPEAKVTLTMPIPEDKQGLDNYLIYHLKENGEVEWLKATVSEDGKTISFEVSAFSTFGIVIEEDSESDEESDDQTGETPVISYQTHVENVGWQEQVTDGALSGTEGRGLRLEGIKIKVNTEADLGIAYQTQIENIGWQDEKTDGDLSGTEGQGLRLEGIKIHLTGNDADKYDIYYRVHAQNFGWMDWAKNGQASGTEGFGDRLEAIEIRIVEKDGRAPGETGRPFATNNIGVFYQTQIQNVGWQDERSNGLLSGTEGQGLRLEGIKIKMDTAGYDVGVTYQTHVENIGWQDQVSDGALSGTEGQSLRLEGIKINLTGQDAELCDIYYQVHAQNVGWMDWAKNGQAAGTEGFGYRLEGIRIVVVAKDQAAPGATGAAFISNN